jgi:hypothetical protein
MSIILCICFEIHLSVRAPFQGAGVAESNITGDFVTAASQNGFSRHVTVVDENATLITVLHTGSSEP